ncbi:indolepyruvate ferredoxin oxidoreductase family protein [Actinomadura madurae]|uniref:indolepyruvate ferredoxin oxidoreductase family protein n=1 Tax=Actinomadura madurae TaxID=1993 RepID=UPI002025BE43|nr:indolepyruvate ferredoxin oxidoreductase family protein [Actinomadura madurae]URM93896.1 indolepyruvate ferredoxin oxidoreductase family protein [Actinomadura madurae]
MTAGALSETAETTGDYRLEAKYEVGDERALLTGVQAIARALIEQHARDVARGRNTSVFVSGYQGSPLGGLDSLLASIPGLREDHQVHLSPGVNEELAATAVWGTQIQLPDDERTVDGVVGVWYGKGPGLDRASDAIRHATMYGTDPRGGVVAFVGDDPSSKSSTLPYASDATLAALNMPFFTPRNGTEVVLHTLAAVELSRFTGCWVGVKVLSDVADGVWTVAHDFQAVEFDHPEVTWRGRPWVYAQQPVRTPGESLRVEAELTGPRWAAVEAFLAANDLDRVRSATPRPRFGVIGSGVAVDAAVQAFQDLGLDPDAVATAGISIVGVAAPYPLDRGRIRAFAEGLDTILVVEEKAPVIERQVKDILYSLEHRPAVLGKRDAQGAALVPGDGELLPERLHGPIRRAFGGGIALRRPPYQRRRLGLLPVQRTPYFCSGCPHNSSTVVPDGSIAGGGIGCHTLASVSARQDSAITGWTQMGGEGAQWIGQAAWSSHRHIFQNVGDGTFFHSGQLAVQAAVAAGVNITYKVLYNSAVAMTGAQDPQAGLPVPALARKLLAEGVVRIIVCADEPERYRRIKMPRNAVVWPRERLDEAQRVLREVEGVTVLVYDQQCAANARRLRKRGKLPPRPSRVVINQEVCEGCGDCGVKSNCLSVQPIDTDLGRKTRIDQTSCNTDYSCLAGDCPSFVTVTDSGRRKSPRTKRKLPKPPAAPDVSIERAGTDVFMAGIGGTGIVTVNQIIATAALTAGYEVVGLDQTGLSQKAGPVVSHLRLVQRGDAASNRVGEGAADLFLAFDLLVAAEEKNASRVAPGRTTIVASTSITPTGDMVANASVAYPGTDTLLDRLAGPDTDLVRVDALQICETLFGSIQSANLLLVGAAYQTGRLPIPAQAIEEAITLNGVAVAANISAFRWGRAIAADPTNAPVPSPGAPRTPSARVAQHIDASGFTGETRRIVVDRSARLEAYQGPKLAVEYVGRVSTVWAKERQLGDGSALSEQVARHLYKLTAYKDEYEVARLLTAPEFLASVRAEGGSGRAAFHLHPPTLRALGMGRKLQLGPSSRPVLRALASLKFQRGHWYDPFAHTAVRRLERHVLAEYVELVGRLTDGLSSTNYSLATRIAALPDQLRGYEDVKLRSAEAYERELATLSADWRATL